MLQNYNECTFCKSKKIVKLKKENVKNNFYVDAILSDLKITRKKLSRIQVYKCQNCKIKLNNPWFTKFISRKIYSIIYGQHNRSWNNLIHFIEHKKLPNHGDLFKILRKKNINSIIMIREILNDLIVENVEINKILVYLLNKFKKDLVNEKISKNLFYEIFYLIINTSHNTSVGLRPIIHLENCMIKIIDIL